MQRWKNHGRTALTIALALAATAPAGAADPQPATLNEAIEVIDLRSFPVMEGAVSVEKSPVGSHYSVPKGDVAKAVEFYRTKLTALGWKPADDPKVWVVTKDGAQLIFTKNGFVLYAAIGASPADGSLNVGLFHVGNIDARTLPRIAGAEAIDEMPFRAIYRTEAKPDDIAKFVRGELKARGWTEYSRPAVKGVPADSESDFREWRFFNRGIGLDVTTMPFAGKIQVYMTLNVLKEQLPLMPDAFGIELEVNPLFLYYLTGAEPKAVTDFYEKELAALGWTRRAGAGTVTENEASIAFDAPDREPLRLEYLRGKAGTVVRFTRWKQDTMQGKQ